jgi:hypothetical protein
MRLPVFAQRAAALTELIRQDPKAALGLALSKDLRDELAREFPNSASNLEEEGEWTGTSDHLIFDDPDRQVRRFQVSITAGGSSAEVYSAGGEPHCVSGDSLTAAGIKVGNVIAAGSTKVSAGSNERRRRRWLRHNRRAELGHSSWWISRSSTPGRRDDQSVWAHLFQSLRAQRE